MDNNQNNIRNPGSNVRLSTVATSTRQTPKTDFGTVMRDGLVRAGNVAVDGLRVAAPFVPGGAIVSAALAGGQQIAGNVGASVDTHAYNGMSYGAGAGSAGRGGGIYGSSSAGLTAPGAGPAASATSNVGNYGATGTLALPGARPGLGTDLNTNSTSFSPGSTATAGSSDAFNQMMSATKQMAEFQASFNLQYLQLQEKIQIDSRQFNLVSNIMKTKHDAAKNALNNVR